MTSKHIAFLTLAVVAGAALGFSGAGFGAGQAAPATSPRLVSTYSDLATVLLSSKKTEASLVRAICEEAFDDAHRHMSAAAHSVEAGKNDVAATHLEQAAAATAMIASEGDKAVAAVRNRLLEGGHHHHSKPEVAVKYDPGYVVITKAAKKLLLADAGAMGRMAGAVVKGEASVKDIRAAAQHLTDLYGAAVK